MDGNGTLFGVLAGNTREVLHKFTVDLPKKHGRGGQSALRFSRLRDEKRHNYVRKVAELAVQHFITNDKVNVTGLVLAGSADFKTELSQSDMLDQRLAAKIIKVVDVSYGGENGFNQVSVKRISQFSNPYTIKAIESSSDSLSNVKFVQEKRLIQKYFDEISQDTGKYCFGVDDTLKALELGAVETLIVWENLDITRYVLRNAAGGMTNHSFSEWLGVETALLEEIVIHVNKEQEKDREKFIDKSTGVEMEQLVEPQSLLEWFAEKYKEFGAALEFVTNKSQEGAQFVKGFGGIGGLLRYKIDFTNLVSVDDDEDEFYSDDDDIWRYCRLFGAPSYQGTTGGGGKETEGKETEGMYQENQKVELSLTLKSGKGYPRKSFTLFPSCLSVGQFLATTVARLLRSCVGLEII